MARCMSIHGVGADDQGRQWSTAVLCVVILLFVSCSSDIKSSKNTIDNDGLSAPRSSDHELSSSVQKQARRLLKRIELAGTGVNLADVRDHDAEELSGLIDEVDDHLRQTVDDVPALILSARLHRALLLLEPAVFGNAASGSSEHFDHSVAALDRAVALAPDNADAYYWKARVLGLKGPVVRDNGLYFESRDLEAAIRSARTAVDLSPEEPAYREVLAMLLLEDGRQDEAFDAIRTLRRGSHPIARLLQGWEGVPIPDNAVALAHDAENLAEQQMSRGRFMDYPKLRVRFFMVPSNASDIEAFYSKQWPGFELFASAPETPGAPVETAIYHQYLKEKKGALTPAKTAEKLPAIPKGGIMLAVTEFHHVPAAARPKSQAGDSATPDVFCYLVLVNYAS
jgi:tetratricopeptide (TPR) repeat protein